MIASVVFEDHLAIPRDIDSLESFRKWMHSPQFPDTGRIDYYQGTIEVDMSPESLYTHSTAKTELVRVLSNLVKEHDLGDIFVDSTRITFPTIEFSSEPDICFLSNASLDASRVHRISGRQQRLKKFIEIQGPPDLIVEIVSDSSVIKDLQKLPLRYFDGGVLEYWIVDARLEELVFDIYARGKQRFTKVRADARGFAKSRVFDRQFRLLRTTASHDRWRYDLEVK